MDSTLVFILVIVLGVILYQDITARTIHAILPLLVFVLACILNYFSDYLNFYNLIYNITFIFINILGLVLYFSFKSKTFKNPIDNTLGLGDVMFFLAITPLFNLKPYILFFVLGLLFSLIVFSITSFFKKVKTVPLAGYLAMFLILNIVIKNIFKIETLY